jgi:hypothetical protein
VLSVAPSENDVLFFSNFSTRRGHFVLDVCMDRRDDNGNAITVPIHDGESGQQERLVLLFRAKKRDSMSTKTTTVATRVFIVLVDF